MERKVVNEYALYDKHDNLLFTGNSTECSKFLNITVPSFYSRISNLRKGKWNGKFKGTIVVIDK